MSAASCPFLQSPFKWRECWEKAYCHCSLWVVRGEWSLDLKRNDKECTFLCFQFFPYGSLFKNVALGFLWKECHTITHTHTPFLWPLRDFTKDELGAELKSLWIKAHRTYLRVGGACFKVFLWEPPAIDTTQKERISLEPQQYLWWVTVGLVRLSIVSASKYSSCPPALKPWSLLGSISLA